MAEASKKTAKPEDTSRQVPGYSTAYDYVLDWIKEATDVRRAQNALVERAVNAYQEKPSVNRYKGAIKKFATEVRKTDIERAKQLEALAADIPEKASPVIQNGVETLVSMAQGGVGQYEFGPYDPQMKHDDRVIDRLAAQAKHFYNMNRVDAILPQWIRNAALCGVGDVHLKKKGDKTVMTLLETSQMIKDPKRFKTNYERFIGHSQVESFQAVKKRVKKTKGGGYVLKTLNMAEVYVNTVKQEINNVLVSNQRPTQAGVLHDELSRDIDLFYQPVITRMKTAREGNNGDPNKMYDGDEIECTYLYDLMTGMYFEVVNRRYIIVAKQNDLKRDIECTYTDDQGKERKRTKTVLLDHPYVELPFMKLFWSTYPVTPLFYCLDDFDDLCAMESVLYHTLSIMAPISFVGQSTDAEKMSRVASIAGEVIEGLQQTFGVLDKSHDVTPIVTAIQRYEERIKRRMKAVDPFELQGMIGDRATAKEVVSASGQVSQGINPFIANIEAAMATLGDKFIKLELIYGDKEMYEFEHNGRYYEVSRGDMAIDREIYAKLVSSIKLEQEANSRKALELIQYLNGNEAIDPKEFLGATIPIVLNSLVNREQAFRMVREQYKAMPEEVIASIKERLKAEMKRDPVDRLDLNGYAPEDLDRMALQFSGGGLAAPADAPAPAPADQLSVGTAMPGGEEAGVVANDPAGGAYV